MAKKKQNINVHSDWLNLVELGGLILSEPVLLEDFPAGFDYPKPYVLKGIRTNFERFDLDNDKNASRSFVDYLLEKVLGYKAYKEHNIPDYSKCYLDEFAQELKPHRVVESGERRLNVYISEKNQNLKRNEQTEGRWKASPIVKMQRLLQETGQHFGLISNGYDFIFIYRPEEGGFSSIGFEMEFMLQEPSVLAAFLGILDPENFKNILELAKRSYENQLEVTDKLGEQVRNAVERFVWAMDHSDAASGHTLLQDETSESIYEMAIAAIMRSIFLLYAEERELLPYGELMYDRGYSIHTLIKDLSIEKRNHPELFTQNSDGWQRMLALFNLIYFGSAHNDMLIPEYSGEMFDPERYTPLYDANFKITNEELYTCMRLLTHREEKGIARAISYKTIGVEHIGYIYEGLLDYTVGRNGDDVLVKPLPKTNEAVIALSEIEALGVNEYAETVKKLIGKKPTASMLRKYGNPDEKDMEILKEICDDDTVDRLMPFASLVQLDEIVRPHQLYLTVSSSRRATGAHYTPEALTEKIVKTTLEPLVYECEKDENGNDLIGKLKEPKVLKCPKEILDLNVADIAMGSGAFLVQVIRYLADRLVEAWQLIQSATESPVTIPYGVLSVGGDNEHLLPDEYKEQLELAKRFVARECIYGVDINPLAVEVAKLSVWLETMAKDMPFTFVDHRLMYGDSLFGIASLDELKNLANEQSLLENGGMSYHKIEKAIKLRKEIQQLPDMDVADRKKKKRKLEKSNREIKSLMAYADALVSSYMVDRAKVKGLLSGINTRFKENGMVPETSMSKSILGEYHPFHWILAFPEVFLEKDGLDAIVGNPPFLGGQKITGFFGTEYRNYLVDIVANGKNGSADLVSYFFLRAYALLKTEGTFGLLATNTIAEGKTREVGLMQLTEGNATIYSAYPNEAWPGNAAVVTSRVHIAKTSDWKGSVQLNDTDVSNINSFLSTEDDRTPNKLKSNINKTFQGTIILGSGFVISEEESLNFLEENDAYKDVLFPYLNGKDFTSTPEQTASRWVINFWDWPIEKCQNYSKALNIVEKFVKPERQRKKEDGSYALRKPLPERWWQYAEKRPALYHAIGRGSLYEKHPKGKWPEEAFKEILVISAQATKYVAIAAVPNNQVFSNSFAIFAFEQKSYFALLQSGIQS